LELFVAGNRYISKFIIWSMEMKKPLLVIILLFSLIACSQQPGIPMEAAVTPTFTPYVGGTETAIAMTIPWAAGTEGALATPTPWVGGTQTALAVATQDALLTLQPSEVTQVAMEKPTDFSPVLYGGKLYDTPPFFLLLGGVSRDEWLTPDESVERFSGEVTYSLHSLEQEYKYFLWGKKPELQRTCESYIVGTDAGLDEAGFVTVVDGWDVTKRDADELSEDGEFYQQAVIDWLADEGVDAPQLGNLQIFRVDIEGDGSDEIFISATHLDDSQHTTKAGDYSVILMVKVVGNDVITKLVVGDVYGSQEPEITFPRTYSLANFIDLNQDGVLEVVVDIQQWEGFGAIVFQFDGQDVIQALRAEC
jgi:hypothetical protein